MTNPEKGSGGAKHKTGPKIDGEPRSIYVGVRLKPSTVKKLDSLGTENRSKAIEKCIEEYKLPKNN